MYQKTLIVGRLGQDPELHYTPNAIPVVTFSVAVDEGYGETKKTIWYRVSAWRKTAEFVAQHCPKGALVFVSGEMNTPKPYQHRDGEWRCNLEMTAREVKLLSGGKWDKAAEEVADTEGTVTPEDLPF